jgi:WD40 repeat protein
MLQSQDRIFDMYWFTTAVLLGTASPDQRHPRLWKNLVASTAPPQVAADYVYLSEQLGVNQGKGDCPWAHCDAVKGLDGSNTQSLLFSGSMDNSVIAWDVTAENRVAQYTGHTNTVESVLFLESDGKLASGSADTTVKIWTVPSSAPYSDSSSPAQTLSGQHSAAVNALAWVVDGSTGYLASGGADGKVALYTCSWSR